MIKRKLLSALLLLGISGLAGSTRKAANGVILAGSYTDDADTRGIRVLSFNRRSGALAETAAISDAPNASYLAWSKDRRFVYAVNENESENDGVSAFRFNAENHTLTPINQQPAHGSAACYLALDHSGRHLAVANYLSGNVSLYDLDGDGAISPLRQSIQLPDLGKQPHAHTAVFSPHNRFLFITDLGNDRIYQYPFDAGALMPVQPNPIEYRLPEGHGPRHLVFSRDGQTVYLINEWAADIAVYRLENHALVHRQTLAATDTAPPHEANKGGAAVRISPDSRFLYASVRGSSNHIAAFQINADGLLTKIGEQPVDLHPRYFIIDHSGRWLLVAARDENTIRTYRINAETGLLSDSGEKLTVSKPVMLLEYS